MKLFSTIQLKKNKISLNMSEKKNEWVVARSKEQPDGSYKVGVVGTTKSKTGADILASKVSASLGLIVNEQIRDEDETFKKGRYEDGFGGEVFTARKSDIINLEKSLGGDLPL